MLKKEHIQALVDTRMPFGRYEGRPLIDIPEQYLIWMVNQGLPEGELGQLLELALDIHREGLTSLVRGLRNR